MEPFLADPDVQLYNGDCLEVLRTLPDQSVHMCATSPPFYGLRDYGTGTWEGGDEACDHKTRVRPDMKADVTDKGYAPGSNFANYQAGYESGDTFLSVCGKCGARRIDRQIGLEESPDEWVARLVEVFREVRRVLRDDGTLWVEIGDSYSASGRTDKKTDRTSFECGYPECDCKDICRATGREVGRKAEFTERGKERGYDPGSNWSNYGASGRDSRVAPGTKSKDLLGQPWLLAFALRADGWYLRSEIIWARPNPMPESVTDRPTKAHSTVFLLSKSPRYFYDQEAVREPYARVWDEKNGGSLGGTNYVKDANVIQGGRGNTHNNPTLPRAARPTPQVETLDGSSGEAPRGPDGRRATHVKGAENSEQHRDGERWPASGANARSVWQIPTEPTPFAHFATWPQKLVQRMILAGCPEGGVVLDPFGGSGTTALVARKLHRQAVLIELNESYCAIAALRLSQQSLFAEAS